MRNKLFDEFKENFQMPIRVQINIQISVSINLSDKGNNKITELRTILQREGQNS
jgi:hypothetical protein